MKSYGVTVQMKPLQQYFHMVPFILYVVLTLESVDEILRCYHSNELSLAALSHGTIYFVCSSNSWVCGWNPEVLPFKWTLFSSTFSHMVLFILYVVQTFEFVDKILLPFKWNPFSSTFTWYYLFSMYFKLLSLWTKSCSVTIQMKPLQPYFHMVLFI